MEVANVVGTRGAKWGAVRLGCGIAGATLMAVALPVSTGWGAIGSPSPKPAEAAAICNVNRAFANGSGRSGPAGVDETSYGPETRGTVVRIQRDAGRARPSPAPGSSRCADRLKPTPGRRSQL